MSSQGWILTSEQTKTTLEYLQKFNADSNANVYGAKAAVLAAFARACLLLMAPGGTGAARALEEAERLADSLASHPQRDKLDLDPMVLASYYSVLFEQGLKPASLSLLVQDMANILKSQPDAVRMRGRVRLTSSMLSASGVHTIQVAAPKGAASPLLAPHEMLEMPEDAIQELVDQACADGIKADEDASTILALIALTDLRNYRIDLGARIARYLILHGVRNDYLDESINFISLQRCGNGAYGFSDPTKEENAAIDKRDALFHLPITLNAIWTLSTLNRTSSGKASSSYQP